MKTNRLKKLGLAVTSAMMMFTSALGNLNIVSAKEVKYSIREYETGYKTDRGTNLLKLRIKGSDIPNYGSHWGQVAFCVQHGESLPKGSHIFNNGDPTGIYKNAARVAYLATYRYNNGESGGMKRYAYTQNLIWQVLGQVSQSHSMGDDYSSWKNKIMDEYNKWDTMPSFNTSTQKFELGQSKNLKDTNGVLKYYDTFNYAKDGVTFEHTKGINVMKVTVSANCSKKSVAITTTDAIKGKMSKYANTNTSQVNFVLKSTEKQDLICAPGYSDPKYLNIKIDINSFGSLEIAKKDNKGNYVPNVSFKVSYNADMSSPIGTYKTGENGKVTVKKLKAGKIYVQETKVPEHLMIDKTIHEVTIKSNDVSTFTATNDWKQGYIQVTKKDAKTGQVVKKAGTEFEIVQGTKVIETIITNENGIAKSGLLDYGTYIIREKKEPANYVIATLTKEQSITQNGKVYAIDIYNEPVLGQINLSKEDKETRKISQGDATLKGAQYTLKANDKIVNPANGTVIYKKGEVISVKKIGNFSYGDIGTKTVDDKYNISWKNLPMGEYIIEETKVPVGYLIDGTHKVTLEKTSSTKALEIKDVLSQEDVIKGQLEVAKSGHSGESGVVDGLEGIEFTMKLKSEVNAKGWDQSKVYSVITTDKNGKGISDKVPYGTYIVRETKTTPNYQKSGDFFVTIDKNKEVEYRMVNNKPFEAWLQLIKTDENGKTVQLSHATFKIKDAQGNYLKQKVGLFYKDEWSTDKDGMVILDDMVKAGTYTLEEIKSPDGFLLSDSISFTISSEDKGVSFDDDGDPVFKITIQNEKPTGTIVLEKSFEQCDDSVAPEKENLQAKFKLFANSDIVDPADGSNIYHKGDIVKMDNSLDGIHTTSKDGKLEITGLPVGTGEASYILKEVDTEKGYVLNKSVITYDFKMEDVTTKIYKEVKKMENKLTTSYFKKTDVAGKEVEGAQLVLKDKEGKIIDEWTSSKEEHIIKGLIIGESYTLHEKVTAEGYVKASDITFTFEKDQQKTVMIDKIVSISKTDVTGEKEIEGAKLTVTDKDGQIVDEWISTDKEHYVNGLEEGKVYTLTETIAPDGYIKAESITFEVSTDKEVQLIVMKDKQVSIQKIDQTGNAVIGAQLQIIEKDTQEIIETFVTGQDDYYAKNVEIGKTYILKEIETPENYIKADDIEFTVTKDDENQVISMIDIKLDKVVISKQDATTKEELEGAHLKITDEDDKVIEEWVSTKEPHEVMLEVGKTYTLTETTAPNGYNIAESITFTVDDNGDVVQKVVMLDEHIPTIVKTGDNLNILPFVGLSLCALVGILVFKRRGKANEQ